VVGGDTVAVVGIFVLSFPVAVVDVVVFDRCRCMPGIHVFCVVFGIGIFVCVVG